MTAPDDIDLDRIEQTARDTLRFVEDKRCNEALASLHDHAPCDACRRLSVEHFARLVARVRAAEARVAELEATNERLLSSDPSEVCAAWRDGFTSGVLGEKPPHGTTHVTRLGRIAQLEAALGEALDGWVDAKHDGPTDEEWPRIAELRKLVKP